MLSFFTYTPLIASTDFDGPMTDLMTTTSGVISLVLVIAGAGLIISILWRAK